jgi:hypothetical protein
MLLNNEITCASLLIGTVVLGIFILYAKIGKHPEERK